MYQQITIVGNLGRDPEMRYTASGVAVTSFSLATSHSWVDREGQRQEKTVWFNVSAWERQAELANQYLSKGRQVLVVGEMEDPYVYTDQAGNQRASLQVRAFTIRFLGSRDDAGMGDGMQATPSAARDSNAEPAASDEEIPF